MRRIIAAAICGLLTLAPVSAGQMSLLGAGKAGSVAAYTGPGDIVSGAWAFYSCRAYSLAKAGTKAYRIVRASDSAQTDINSLSSGLCDTATPTTFCNATSCKVVTYYDQTGTNACTGATACDMTQPTDGARFSLNLTALNSAPCAASTNANFFYAAPAFAATQAQPVTYVALAARTSNFTTVMRILTQETSDVPRFSFNTAVDSFVGNAGTSATAVAATDNAFHVLQFIFNGASSIGVSDASATTGLNAGTSGLGTTALRIGGPGNSLGNGTICEAAVYPIGFNATQYGNINTNLHSAAFGWNF